MSLRTLDYDEPPFIALPVFFGPPVPAWRLAAVARQVQRSRAARPYRAVQAKRSLSTRTITTVCSIELPARPTHNNPEPTMTSNRHMNYVLSMAYPFEDVAEPAIVTTSEIDGMRAATIGGADASRQVLLFMGFLAVIEPFELQRFALLAQIWDAQITVVDVPGCGYGRPRLHPRERRGLRSGDFTAVAHRMVKAAVAHNPQLAQKPLILVGYSMGASLGAAASGVGQLDIDHVVLVEPVATRCWNIVSLIGCTRAEDKVLGEYLDRNRSVAAAVAPVDRRGDPRPPVSRIDLAHLGFALTRGRIAADLRRGHRRHGFTVHVMHGERSLLSRAADVAGLAADCRRAGLQVHTVRVAGRHALWHSLPDVAALARIIMKQW